MPDDALYIGLDLGTSGARAVAVDAEGGAVATARAATADFGSNTRDPALWWQTARQALGEVVAAVSAARIAAVAVDGTSGTMLAVDSDGAPLADGLMYNDPCADPAILAAIDAEAPEASAARGASSALARALRLSAHAPAHLLHQADWIAYRLSGRRLSDTNNALKTGYDPVACRWPDWIVRTGLAPELLPPVVEPGTPTGHAVTEDSRALGLPNTARIVAGSTDGCASFLATGAAEPGDGVTALGTTLTVKILSDIPIFAPVFGIYSHRLLGRWLAGGASNTGGAALLTHFTIEDIIALMPELDPDRPTGLDYYPLPKPGERFPIADPVMPPRTEPRPARRAEFLQGLLEGIAGIEALGYARLKDLGAPPLRSLRSVGGGARNPAWSRIRERCLGVPFVAPLSDEAAYGTALLARAGAAA